MAGPSGRRRSAAAYLLRSWVRIPPGAWMFFCCECCVLSGRGLCDELITRPEESYRLWCIVVCDVQGPAEIPDDFATQLLSGTVGVGNLSFSALLAILKVFQLPWSAGL